MSREYVSTEFKFRPISLIVHRSAGDKLAVDSLVLLVCGLSLIPLKREKERLANCVQSKNCKLVSDKLSKCLYTHGYTHLITSSALNEYLSKQLLYRMSLIIRNARGYRSMTKAVPSGFYVLRHPNHLLLAGVNNRNVSLPNDSKQPLIKQIEIFSGILTVYFNCKYFPKYMRELLACVPGISPSGRNPCERKCTLKP